VNDRSCLVGLIVVAALSASLVPADRVAAEGREGPGQERVVLIVERTNPGPSHFKLQLGVWPTDRGGFLGEVEARLKAGRIVDVFFGHGLFIGGSDEPEAYASGRVVSTCDVGVCDLFVQKSLASSTEYEDRRGGDAFNRLFVALWGRDVDYSLEAKGWTLRRVDWDFRFVNGDKSDAVGVETGGEMGAEVFMDASARGSRYGSFGVAVAPCSTTTLSVPPRGVGQATLDGGVERKTVTCPADGEPVVPSAPERMAATWAPRATRWRFHGTVAGDTSFARTRLFVLDLPKGFLHQKR
jgi:hypothetical protein